MTGPSIKNCDALNYQDNGSRAVSFFAQGSRDGENDVTGP